MICVVGVGKMGAAIVAGLTMNGRNDITLVEHHPETREQLSSRFASLAVVEQPVPCDGAIIAVKPKDVMHATAAAADAGAQRILSIAAGVTLHQLHEAAGGRIPVLRAMPNIGAVHQTSATAYCFASPAREADAVWAEEVLRTFGLVVRVGEELMDAVTGLAGSGPAYIFTVVEALIDAGVHAGLTPEVSKQLTIATVQGASRLLDDAPAAQLREMVTTPAGTTASGLRALESHGVRAAFIDAVLAAAHRSAELGAPKH